MTTQITKIVTQNMMNRMMLRKLKAAAMAMIRTKEPTVPRHANRCLLQPPMIGARTMILLAAICTKE